MVAERNGLGKTGSGGLRQEGEKGVLGRRWEGGEGGRMSGDGDRERERSVLVVEEEDN